MLSISFSHGLRSVMESLDKGLKSCNILFRFNTSIVFKMQINDFSVIFALMIY